MVGSIAWTLHRALHCSGFHPSLTVFMSHSVEGEHTVYLLWKVVISRSKISLLVASFSATIQGSENTKICLLFKGLSLQIPDHWILKFYWIPYPWYFIELIFQHLEHMYYQDVWQRGRLLLVLSRQHDVINIMHQRCPYGSDFGGSYYYRIQES